MLLAGIAGPLMAMAPSSGYGDTPMDYTVGFGTKSYPVVNLLWALLIVSLLVIAIVSGLLLAGLLRQRPIPAADDPRRVPIARPDTGLSWIYIGSAISAAVLVGAAIWTFSTLAAVSTPPSAPRHKSLHRRPSVVVGNPLRDQRSIGRVHNGERNPYSHRAPSGHHVSSFDVIHSFWVPELSGKIDVIPGQQNETWIEADRPGLSRAVRRILRIAARPYGAERDRRTAGAV